MHCRSVVQCGLRGIPSARASLLTVTRLRRRGFSGSKPFLASPATPSPLQKRGVALMLAELDIFSIE